MVKEYNTNFIKIILLAWLIHIAPHRWKWEVILLKTSFQAWEVGLLREIGMLGYLKDEKFSEKENPRIIEMFFTCTPGVFH